MNTKLIAVLKKSKSSAFIGFSSALVCSAPAAVVVTNGYFEGTDFVNVGTTGVTFGAYNTDGDGWYVAEWTSSANGGPTGTGDGYGSYTNAATSNRIRGVMNLITDNNATTGSVTMSVDLLASLFTATNNFYNVKVWGINDSDLVTSGMQWDGFFDLNGPSGNADALDLRNIGQSSTGAVSYGGRTLMNCCPSM